MTICLFIFDLADLLLHKSINSKAGVYCEKLKIKSVPET